MKIYKPTTNKNKVHFDLTMLRRSLIIAKNWVSNLMRLDRLRHIKSVKSKFKILCNVYPWLRSVPQKSIINYLKPFCPYLLVVHLDSQSLLRFFIVSCSPEHFFIGRDLLPLFRDFIERITLAINQQAISNDCRLGSFFFPGFLQCWHKDFSANLAIVS